MNHRSIRNTRGYTLLELIVSVGIFSMVMLIVTSAYLTLVHLDRKARATSDVMTNLSFVVESMTREIRTGTDYKCNTTGTNCATIPGTSFRFTDSRATPRTVTYSVSGGQIFVTIDGIVTALTDPRVQITTLNFYVRGVGTTAGDAYLPPQVTFVIKGTLQPEPGTTVSFSLEGSATERFIELI